MRAEEELPPRLLMLVEGEEEGTVDFLGFVGQKKGATVDFLIFITQRGPPEQHLKKKRD